MYKDEGIGTYIVKYFESNFLPHIDVDYVDGGLLGFGLMPYFSDYDVVLLVGANSLDASAGTLSFSDATQILQGGANRKSANEAELVMMLEVATLGGTKATVEMVGIVPEDTISVANDLSDTMYANFEPLVLKTLERLQAHGVTLQRKKDTITKEMVVLLCANPSICTRT